MKVFKEVLFVCLVITLSVCGSGDASAQASVDAQQAPNVTNRDLPPMPPYRKICLKNSDCVSPWVCVPELHRCSVTGARCDPDDRTGKDCSVGCKGCSPANEFGLCEKGHWSQGCKENSDCKPWFNEDEGIWVQRCLKGPKIKVGQCGGCSGYQAFCNLDAKVDECPNLLSACESISRCAPPEEAERKLQELEVPNE